MIIYRWLKVVIATITSSKSMVRGDTTSMPPLGPQISTTSVLQQMKTAIILLVLPALARRLYHSRLLSRTRFRFVGLLSLSPLPLQLVPVLLVLTSLRADLVAQTSGEVQSSHGRLSFSAQHLRCL